MNETPGEGRSVLIVEDDEVLRSRLLRAFSERGFDVRSAGDGPDAIRLAREESPECAVVDLRLGATSGLEIVRELHQIDPATRIVMLTGYGSIATALDALRSGAVHYLTKPASMDEIISAFEHDGSPAKAPPPASVPSLDRVEWEHIDRVLQESRGNITQAAQLLGLHRRSLQRKLAKRPLER